MKVSMTMEFDSVDDALGFLAARGNVKSLPVTTTATITPATEAAPVPKKAAPPKKAEPKADEVKAAPPAPPPKAKPEQLEIPETKVAPPAKKAAAAKPKTSDGAGQALDIELPDDIKNANAVREVLVYLSEHGVTNVDDMVKTCEALRDVVPVLGKVPDVDSRVRRAVSVLALFDPPAVVADEDEA